ncbi:nucleolar complex-associated protein [Dictyocaulus viviparus]|uniref:Nucleolar complex-associated protein n=1 Tax=Dictyocaulus viviparus TaxID=29172 RepID=A0A0D8XQZ4_DICVI|nr:nucleolar complex-associated protein [Dictyocaulus viviparus]
MGFASASREEKLKMMKTSHTRKTTRKLNRLGKNKKLSRGVINELKKIKARRCKDSRERIVNIEDDWIAEREWHFNNGAEGILPLDMLDADINWENSSFAGIKRRHDQKFESGALITSNANRDIEKNKRNFEGHLDENFEEMLPIKLKDGRILRPVREKDLEADQDDSKWINSREEVKTEFESFSELSAAELLIKRKEMIHQYKQSISNSSQELLTSPQENIYKLRDLLGLCQGENVHSLVRETIQKLALISTMQVFVDIVPGYSIREFTEQEKHQKMKKETKKLRVFEETLLRYYLKFLQFCEKKDKKYVSLF